MWCLGFGLGCCQFGLVLWLVVGRLCAGYGDCVGPSGVDLGSGVCRFVSNCVLSVARFCWCVSIDLGSLGLGLGFTGCRFAPMLRCGFAVWPFGLTFWLCKL